MIKTNICPALQHTDICSSKSKGKKKTEIKIKNKNLKEKNPTKSPRNTGMESNHGRKNQKIGTTKVEPNTTKATE